MTATCRCRHDLAAHIHNRPGTDCGQCTCARFRRRWVLR